MKVILISHYPPPAGGIASWTKRILNIGLPGDWQVLHINSNMIGGRDPFKNTKVSLKDEVVRSFSIWKKEIAFLKDKDAKIVHTCIPCTLPGMVREIITGMIAKIYKRKFILHCRCTVPNVVNSIAKIIVFKLLAGFCDGIMVLNQKSYDFSRKNTSTDVRLIPNFVSDSEFADIDNKQYSGMVKNALYVGGVTHEKGCDIIIRAANNLPEVTFHLLGNISEEIQNMNKPENVVLYGNKDKAFVQEMYAKCDVFLFLTHFWGEGFSNSLVEAMSAGLPCIVSDWAANADMIGKEGGFIVLGTDESELVHMIQNCNDPLVRKSMGERNAATAREDYCESVVLNAYVKMYEDLLK